MVNLLQNDNKTANINVKNFHRSLTTVVRAQNDTSKVISDIYCFRVVILSPYNCS